MFYLFERYCPFCGKREAATATPPAEQGADEAAPAEQGADEAAPAEQGADEAAPAEQGADEAAPALIYGGRQYGPEREKES
jgi:hypothetical protein